MSDSEVRWVFVILVLIAVLLVWLLFDRLSSRREPEALIPYVPPFIIKARLELLLAKESMWWCTCEIGRILGLTQEQVALGLYALQMEGKLEFGEGIVGDDKHFLCRYKPELRKPAGSHEVLGLRVLS